MKPVGEWLRARVRSLEAGLRHRLDRAFPMRDLPLLDPAHGIAGPDGIEPRGRVLPPFCRFLPGPEAPRWRRALRLLGLSLARPVPGVRVAAVAPPGAEAESDAVGRILLRLQGGDTPPGWSAVTIEIAGQPATRADFPVFRPHPVSAIGVIADLDEALVQGATEPLFRRRLAGVWRAARRQSVRSDAVVLIDHLSAHGRNPVFHISDASWPMQSRLTDVLDRAAYEAGPLLMREPTADRFSSDGAPKGAAIDRITAAVPALPFVLVGNTRPLDAAAYLEACRRHGGQIVAVVLRRTGQDHGEAIGHALSEMRRMGVATILCTTLDSAVDELGRLGVGPKGWAPP